MPIDKDESRRIRNEIRRILLQYWDPIGIKDEPLAQDEYDAYLGSICELLLRGATDEDVSNHLWKIIEEQISVHPASGATKKQFDNLEPS
jgi:hypothetical protein